MNVHLINYCECTCFVAMLSVKIKVTNIIIMMDLLQHNEPITCNMAPYKDLFISLSSLPLSIAICYVQKQKKQQATYRQLYIRNLLFAVCARRPCGDPGAGVRQAGVQLPGPREGAVAHCHHRHGGDLHQVTAPVNIKNSSTQTLILC